MKQLNQYQRNAVMYLLEQQDSQAKAVSFSSVFKMGVSEEQIHIIKYVMQTLQSAPFLTVDELHQKGIKPQDLSNTIGSIEEFKDQLGLVEYAFSDWLVAQGVRYPLNKNIVIPYLIYQLFYEDISAFYTVNNKLKPGLEVELSPFNSYTSIRLFGSTNKLIPVKDSDALHLVCSLLSNYYSILKVDESQSSIFLCKSNDMVAKNIEVRCLSSSFSQLATGGVFIFDDINLLNNSASDFIVYPVEKLINKHHKKFLNPLIIL